MTRRLARQLVGDVNVMSIQEVARRHGLPWHFILGLTRSWSDPGSGGATSAPLPGHSSSTRPACAEATAYVTVIINGDTGETPRHRGTSWLQALLTFLVAQGHRWLKKGRRVVVSDGSGAHRASINATSATPPTRLGPLPRGTWFIPA